MGRGEKGGKGGGMGRGEKGGKGGERGRRKHGRSLSRGFHSDCDVHSDWLKPRV